MSVHQSSGDVPQFGWYQPRYLPQREPAPCGFPPLSKVVTSDRLDGDIDDATMQERRAASGFAWERLRPIEEIWNGPPLTTQVPPAQDYERLLLDRPGMEPESQ